MDNKLGSAMGRLKSSKEFKEYKKGHPGCYLASCFKMGDSDLDYKAWQFDFYSQKSGKMTSFQVGKTIAVQKDQDIFSKNSSPEKLEFDGIKVDFGQAMSLVNKAKKETIPAESINKEIVILQKLDGKTVWNITLLTAAFNVLNIRIDAGSGEIIRNKCESILAFKTKQ